MSPYKLVKAGDIFLIGFQWWLGEDVMVVQAVIMADELTRFCLSEKGSSLRWMPVGLVRHMCSSGNKLIQC